jgi:hypothetical protein
MRHANLLTETAGVWPSAGATRQRRPVAPTSFPFPLSVSQSRPQAVGNAVVQSLSRYSDNLDDPGSISGIARYLFSPVSPFRLSAYAAYPMDTSTKDSGVKVAGS